MSAPNVRPPAVPFWLSWYGPPKGEPQFELHAPWWQSGWRLGKEPTCVFVAAVMAHDEAEAKRLIAEAHSEPAVAPTDIEWRFCEPRPADWSPFGGRFERADWMRWPWPAREQTAEARLIKAAISSVVSCRSWSDDSNTDEAIAVWKEGAARLATALREVGAGPALDKAIDEDLVDELRANVGAGPRRGTP